MSEDRWGPRGHRLRLLASTLLAMGFIQPSVSRAADFAAVCEANQVYDTGRLTTEEDRRICRCIQGRLDPRAESAAIGVFQKVLAARRAGGLHPSQVDLAELVALMSFSDSLQACGDQLKAAKAAF